VVSLLGFKATCLTRATYTFRATSHATAEKQQINYEVRDWCYDMTMVAKKSTAFRT